MNRPTWATVSLTTTDAPVSLLMRLALLDHTAARAETEAIDQERNIVLEALLGHEETTATVTDYNTLTAKLEVARAAQQAAYMRVYNLAVEAGMGREQLERLLAGEEPGA